MAYFKISRADVDSLGMRTNDPKPRPNQQQLLKILRSMSPAERLKQAFRLSEFTLKMFRIGLKKRFPDLDNDAFEKVYLEMRKRCHNRNY